MEFIRRAARNGQAAATVGAKRAEVADDGETTWLQRPQRLVHVASPLRFAHQEVKDRAVVPHVIGCRRQLGIQDIGGLPGDAPTAFPSRRRVASRAAAEMSSTVRLA